MSNKKLVTGTMKIIVNSKEKEIDADSSAAYLLEKMNLDLEKTLVTINGQTLSSDEFESAILKESDSVELFSFVGGG